MQRWDNKEARDRTRPITLEDYRSGLERLILSRATHLDQLADKLKEPRVRAVVSPFLQGRTEVGVKPEDVDYVVDLGLLRRETNGRLEIANAIYQEVIPRELSWGSQMVIEQDRVWYIGPDRRLEMPQHMAAFQQFFYVLKLSISSR